jgi:hypothetical protein
VSDKPILFSGPMMNALRAGKKTQTRRVLNPQPEPWRDFYQEGGCQTTDWRFEAGMKTEDGIHHRFGLWMHCQFHESRWQRLPYSLGDRLWCREAWRTECNFDHLPPRDLTPDGQQWHYEADGAWSDPAAPGRLRPGMFMPRWASRAFVTVTDVRVQRLQQISEADAIAEGIVPTWPDGRPLIHDGTGGVCREAYFKLWNHLHGPAADFANPLVAAYSFDVTLRNIDDAAP